MGAEALPIQRETRETEDFISSGSVQSYMEETVHPHSRQSGLGE